jgi:deoxyribodipyrimidine photo-lyase
MLLIVTHKNNLKKPSTQPTLMWFRRDLRLLDNPALASSLEVVPIFIMDPLMSSIGGASKWWLHHALQDLDSQLKARDAGLFCYVAQDVLSVLKTVLDQNNLKRIVWNRVYEPAWVTRDSEIKKALQESGFEVETFNSSLLWEPFRVLNGQKKPYQVFTPFFRKGCLGLTPALEGIEQPSAESPTSFLKPQEVGVGFDQLGLLSGFAWFQKLEPQWQIGEKVAHKKWEFFLKNKLNGYKKGRDFPGRNDTSGLSPFLHWGLISVHRMAKDLKDRLAGNLDADCFLSELGWREFSAYLLYHFPDFENTNFQSRFDAFPWQENSDLLHAWQKGQTGIPIVDAGMRQLWQTGLMHNRLRMVVGSFLVKNLRIHWKKGERWFWDTLLDADLASNVAGWQWVAGTGADAAPYFRVFNPVLQSQRFDPQAEYIKKWVPELKDCEPAVAFAPWEASESVLRAAGVILGQTYPKPIVDLAQSRAHALTVYGQLAPKKDLVAET